MSGPRGFGRTLLLLSLTPAFGCQADVPADSPVAETVATTATRQVFDIGSDVLIEAIVEGEGAPIILLPGSGLDGLRFLPLMPRLATAGYRVLALNPRQVGASEGPLEDLTLHDLAGDVAGVITQLGEGPAHVLGHGFGNRVARCLAADHPELVRSVILLAAGGQVPGDQDALDALGQTYEPGLSDEARLAAIETALFAPGSDARVWLGLPVWPDVRRAQGAADRATPREEWISAGEAVPMLIIQGRHDRVAPPANGRWLSERLGDRVRLVELANAGHALVPEEPDEIVAVIDRFIRELR